MRIRLRMPARQGGAALIVALIVLLALTLLGVTASRGGLLEERMTSNTQDAGVAFQAAEAALRRGEEFLEQPTLPYFEGDDGLYQPAAPASPPVWRAVDWTADDEVRAYDGLDDAPGALSDATAAYVIEQLPAVVGPGESLAADTPVDEAQYFRITARGVGVGGNANVTLQSTYKR